MVQSFAELTLGLVSTTILNCSWFIFRIITAYFQGGLGYLPGGHLPPPKFGHFPPPNSDIYHPPKKHLPGGQLPPPIFFFFFGALFLAFSTYSKEDDKDGKEEVLDEVVMEHIK